MKKAGNIFVSTLFLLTFAVVITSCGHSSSGDNGGGGSLQPVTDSYTAQIVVEDIEDAVTGGIMNHVSPASTVDITVTGKSGSAAVYGKYTTSYCSYSGVTSSVVNIDITFTNFATMGHSTNVEKILNGTVNYQHYYNCDFSYSSYVSSKPSWGGSESPIQIKDIIDGSRGYSDSMTFHGSGDPVSSGWAKPSNGVTYSF
jgi:hypothetical protein